MGYLYLYYYYYAAFNMCPCVGHEVVESQARPFTVLSVPKRQSGKLSTKQRTLLAINIVIIIIIIVYFAHQMQFAMI